MAPGAAAGEARAAVVRVVVVGMDWVMGRPVNEEGSRSIGQWPPGLLELCRSPVAAVAVAEAVAVAGMKVDSLCCHRHESGGMWVFSKLLEALLPPMSHK